MLYFPLYISYCNIVIVRRDLLHVAEIYGIRFFGFCRNALVSKVCWSKMKNVLSAWLCLTCWPVIIILWMTFNMESRQWVTHVNLQMAFFFHISSSFQRNHSIMDSLKVFWHFFICDSLFYPSTHIDKPDFEWQKKHPTLFNLTPHWPLSCIYKIIFHCMDQWGEVKKQWRTKKSV